MSRPVITLLPLTTKCDPILPALHNQAHSQSQFKKQKKQKMIMERNFYGCPCFAQCSDLRCGHRIHVVVSALIYLFLPINPHTTIEG